MFAIFFETESNVVGAVPQYLIFPVEPTSAVIFRRESDGGKGGTNRWAEVDSMPEGEFLTGQPTAVVVTEADTEQYYTKGMPSTLTSKAQRAHEKTAPINSALNTSDSEIRGLVTMVADGDSLLNKYLRDGRRVRPLPQRPVPQVTTPTIVVPDVMVTPEVVEPSVEAVQAVPMPGVTIVQEPAAEVNTAQRMAFVPKKEKFSHYIHRSIGGKQDFEIFDYARKASRNILIYGPTGPGKTTCALAFAAEHGMRVAMVNGSAALEPSHYLGREFIGANGIPYFQYGIVSDVVQNGGMIILDEAGFIPNKIITPLFPLLQYGTRHLTLLENRGETIEAHPDLLIVATMNPHYAGNQALNEALRNRYTIQLNWGYDPEVERQLIPFKSLRDLATSIREREALEEISTPTPTNALQEFVEIAEALGLEFAKINFLNRYDDDEQEAVSFALDAVTENLIADLAGISAQVEETDDSLDAIKGLANLDLSF